MIRQMLDVLVCPYDKESELELFEFNTKNLENTNTNYEKPNLKDSKPTYTNKDKQVEINEIDNNINNKNYNKNKNDLKLDKDEDNNVIIEEGILFCNSCSRFYPIVEEIPIILPDNLREKNKELEILKKWSKFLPGKVVKNALPWHL